METWTQNDPQQSIGTVSDLYCTPQQSTLHLYSQFAEPLFGEGMNQTNRLSDWQNPVFSSIYGARPHWVKLFWYLILLTLLASKVICCQLTGLIGMDGRRSFGEEWGVPAHAHLAHEQGVELTHILCWGFSEKKGRFGRRPLWLRLPLGFKREQTKRF